MQHKKTEVERIRCSWPMIIKKYKLYTKKKLLYFSIIHKWVTQWGALQFLIWQSFYTWCLSWTGPERHKIYEKALRDKWVFRSDLKEDTLDSFLSLSVWWKQVLPEDPRLRTGRHGKSNLSIDSGVRPWRALKLISKILKSILGSSVESLRLMQYVQFSGCLQEVWLLHFALSEVYLMLSVWNLLKDQYSKKIQEEIKTWMIVWMSLKLSINHILTIGGHRLKLWLMAKKVFDEFKNKWLGELSWWINHWFMCLRLSSFSK